MKATDHTLTAGQAGHTDVRDKEAANIDPFTMFIRQVYGNVEGIFRLFMAFAASTLSALHGHGCATRIIIKVLILTAFTILTIATSAYGQVERNFGYWNSPPGSGWAGKTTISPFDGSSESIAGVDDATNRYRLVIGCNTEGKIRIWIYPNLYNRFDHFMESDNFQLVGVKVDDEKPIFKHWYLSEDSSFIGSADGRESKEIISSLFGKTRVAFRFQIGGVQRDVLFTLRGGDRAIRECRKSSNW